MLNHDNRRLLIIGVYDVWKMQCYEIINKFKYTMKKVIEKFGG